MPNHTHVDIEVHLMSYKDLLNKLRDVTLAQTCVTVIVIIENVTQQPVLWA